MARFLALAILLAIGAGVYGFLQNQDAQALKMQLAKAQEDVNTYKGQAAQSASAAKTAAASLDTCTAKVTEVQTALDMANAAAVAKKPAAKKK